MCIVVEMDEADLGEFERMGGPQLTLAVGLYLGGFAASTEPRMQRVSALRETIPAASVGPIFPNQTNDGKGGEGAAWAAPQRTRG